MDEKRHIDFDKRVLERNVKTGRISKEELSKHMDALPDMAEASEDIAEEVFLEVSKVNEIKEEGSKETGETND